MTEHAWREDLATATSTTEALDSRIAAIHRLEIVDDGSVLDVIVDLASEAEAPSRLAAAAGSAAARILHRQARLQAAPLSQFTGVAYVAFDDEAARLLRETPPGE